MLTGSSSELPSSSGTTSPRVTPSSASCFASPLASRSSRPYVSVAPACTTAGRRGVPVHLRLDQLGQRAEPAGRHDRPGQVGEHPPAGRRAEAGGVGRAAGRVGQQLGQHLGDDLGHRCRRPPPRVVRRALDAHPISSPTTQPTLTAAAPDRVRPPTVSVSPPAGAAPIAAVVSPGSRRAASAAGSIRTSGGTPAQVGRPVIDDHPDRQLATEPGQGLGRRPAWPSGPGPSGRSPVVSCGGIRRSGREGPTSPATALSPVVSPWGHWATVSTRAPGYACLD